MVGVQRHGSRRGIVYSSRVLVCATFRPCPCDEPPFYLGSGVCSCPSQPFARQRFRYLRSSHVLAIPVQRNRQPNSKLRSISMKSFSSELNHITAAKATEILRMDRLLHMRVRCYHSPVKVRMVPHKNFRIPCGCHEYGIYAGSDWSREDVADLKAN